MRTGCVWRLLTTCLRGLAMALGACWVLLILYAQVKLLPTFLSPRYQDFWDDVIAYRLRGEQHKSLDELDRAYGTPLVRDYLVDQTFLTAFLPSEKAAFATWVTFNFEQVNGIPSKKTNWLFTTLFAVVTIYVPVALFQRAWAKNLTWWFCRSERSVRLFAGHFAAPWRQRVLGALLTAPVVAVLALWNASEALFPELQQAGVVLVEEALLFVCLAYLSGLGVRALTYAIQGVFLARGVDPQRTFWDEVVAASLAAPALLFVYRNSPLSMLADMVAGLAPQVIAKVLHRLSLARGSRPAPEPNVAVAASGRLAGSLALAGLGAIFCLFSGAFFLQEESSSPTRMTVAEVEAQAPPGRVAWLELTDGFLFMPGLVAARQEGQETGGRSGAGRYYIPHVSKEVMEGWLAAEARGGTGRPFEKCRVVVVFRLEEFRRLFPSASPGRPPPEGPFVPFRVEGAREPAIARAARPETLTSLASGAPGLGPERVLFVENDRRPLAIHTVGSLALVVGLACLLPLAARLLLGWPRPVRKEGKVYSTWK